MPMCSTRFGSPMRRTGMWADVFDAAPHRPGRLSEALRPPDAWRRRAWMRRLESLLARRWPRCPTSRPGRGPRSTPCRWESMPGSAEVNEGRAGGAARPQMWLFNHCGLALGRPRRQHRDHQKADGAGDAGPRSARGAARPGCRLMLGRRTGLDILPDRAGSTGVRRPAPATAAGPRRRRATPPPRPRPRDWFWPLAPRPPSRVPPTAWEYGRRPAWRQDRPCWRTIRTSDLDGAFWSSIVSRGSNWSSGGT